MWIPAQTTVPPLRDRGQRLGHELAGGREDDRGVELLGPLADGSGPLGAERRAPSAWAVVVARAGEGEDPAGPHWRASCATRCAAAPKP